MVDDDGLVDIDVVNIVVQSQNSQNLRLTTICSLNPDTVRIWQVSNPNTTPVNFTWEVSGTTQTGSGTVPGGSEENPGMVTFETAAVATSDTVSISVGGTVQGSATSNSTAATDTATLISAIANANNSAEINTICLADGTYTLTASNVIDYGDNGLPLITSDITLVGLGDNVVIERGAGAPAFRLLHVKDTGTLTLENLTLSNGNAGITHGGAVYARGALTLRDVTITGNFARRGGGVRMNGAPLTVTGSTFQNNSADREGGAIYVSGINSPVDLSTSQFNANSATNSGGGFYLSGTTTSLTANDVVFTGNQANGGGAIYAVPSTLNITNATFTSNEALVSSGGAIYTSTDSSVAVANSTFTTNEAGSDGGALRAGGNLTLTGSTLTSNVSEVGAAVFSQNAAIVIDTRPSFSLLTEMGLLAATDAIVPVEPRYLETVGLLSVIGKINEIRDGWRHPHLKVRGILVTKMDSRVRGHRELLDELQAHPVLGQLLCGVVPHNEAVSYSHHHHMSVFQYDPKAAASKAYLMAVAGLVRASDPSHDRGRLTSRLFEKCPRM